MIVIDLSVQKQFGADRKVIHQINFTGNLYQEGNTTMFLIIEEAKETILDFSLRSESITNRYCFNMKSL